MYLERCGKRDFQTTDQKEEVEEEEADVDAGCLWKLSSGAVADFQQEPGQATHALILGKSQRCECWMQSTQKVGFVALAAAGWEVQVQSRVLSSTALAAHILLQAAEETGSEKLFQTDGRRLRGLHRLAQERFL